MALVWALTFCSWSSSKLAPCSSLWFRVNPPIIWAEIPAHSRSSDSPFPALKPICVPPSYGSRRFYFLPPNTVGGSLNEQSLKLSKATGGIRQCVKVQCVRMDINTKPKAQKNPARFINAEFGLSALGWSRWNPTQYFCKGTLHRKP